MYHQSNHNKLWRGLLFVLVLFLSVPAWAGIKVTGRVQDVNGEPLIGVSIKEKGTTNATITDINGTYNLECTSAKPVLEASYIGFKAEEKKANGTLVDFVLHEEVGTLEEVVITGYTTTKKVSVLGAQSSLKMEHVKAPVANMSTVLAGRVSGVVAVQRTGVPGQDDADIWIRGISTLTNKNEGPLVLVDGIERSFSQLDPEDIESVTVLKDAASTAVYGVRGGNGVIIITTKPGIVSAPKFSFDVYQGVTQLTKTPDLVDGITYMQAANEAYKNSGGGVKYTDEFITNTKLANGMSLTESEQAYADQLRAANGGQLPRTINPYLYPNVDWMREIYHKTGWNRRVNANIRGGAPNASYYISLSYYTEKGLTKTDKSQDYSSEINYDRYNFLTNINLKASKTTNLDVGVSGWISSGNYPNQSLDNIYSRAMQTNPVIYPVQYPNGEVGADSPDNRELDSPWLWLTRRGYQKQDRVQLNTNLKLTQDLGFWDWSKGLNWRALVAFDVRANQNLHHDVDPSTWKPSATKDPITGTWVDDQFLYDEDGNLLLTEQYKGNNTMGTQADKWVYRTFYFETALDYKRTFNRLHSVSGLAVFSLRNYLDANNSDLFSTMPYKQQTLSGRLTYDYDNRYFVEGNLGYTGSENFEPGHRFGLFPAGAIGWVPSNESWWKPLSKVISFFKLRYSIGTVGNSSAGDTGDRFNYFTKIGASDDGYSTYWRRNGGNGSRYYSAYGYKAQWSKIRKNDLGIEMNFLNDDLTVVVDLFKEHRDKIFITRHNLPTTAGFATDVHANMGVVENKGYEASFEYRHQFGKDLYVSVRGNITENEDKIIEDAQPEPAYPWLDQRGHNVLSELGWVAEGLYTSEEQIRERGITQFGESYPGQLTKPGDIMYKDLNGDNHIDDNDRMYISRGDVPRIYYGFGGDVRWKNLGLGILFQGVADADRILRGTGMQPFESSMGGGTLYANITDRWNPDDPENTDVFYPRLAWGRTDPSNENNYRVSTWWKRDFSFLRLKQFTISYYFPKSWNNAVLHGGRFYIMGENVLTFSKFKLWDPELNTDNGVKYPNVRTFSIGVNFNI